MIKKAILRFINRNFQFIKKHKLDLLIIDDLVPSILSPWRILEFNELVKFFPNSIVLADLVNFSKYSQGKTYSDSLEELRNHYPMLAQRLKPLKLFSNIHTQIAYVIFLNNCIKYRPFFERYQIPFAFTLYPGGGFILNNTIKDQQIQRICNSKFFRGVIVNQFLIKEYLLEKGLCRADKIHLIHGIPLNNIEGTSNKTARRDEAKISLVFMAHRYTPYGFDKGFDLFQLIAGIILERQKDATFHVIGNFSPKDFLLHKNLLDRFVFHGLISENKFNEILSHTHFVVSPNRPFAQSEGSFDGFPLGSSVAAGLCGNIMCLTDYFNEGEKAGWIDKVNYLRISYDPIEAAQTILEVFINKELLFRIQKNSILKLKHHYSYGNQIETRLNFFKNEIQNTV